MKHRKSARACWSVCDGISDANELKWNERNLYINEMQISAVYPIIHICMQTTELPISVWNLYMFRCLNFIRHRSVFAHSSLCHATSSSISYKSCIAQRAYIVQQHTKWTLSCFESSDARSECTLIPLACNHVSIFPALPLFPQRQFYRNGNFPQQKHNKICIIKTIDVNH